ncbi:MAG: hypothetical protein LC777_15865, partial [Actinobacteria bacterium]|nr:hypothetical protein [Actinomycetota bacterium]
MQLEERLLGLDQRRLTERRARERRAHEEQAHLHPRAGDVDLRLPPVDFGLCAACVNLRDEHLIDRPPHRPLARTHILADRRLGDLRAVLVDEALPDPLRGMALLARRLAIALKPRVDQRAILAELRGRPVRRRALGRRQRRRQRLTQGTPINTVTLGHLPDR